MLRQRGLRKLQVAIGQKGGAVHGAVSLSLPIEMRRAVLAAFERFAARQAGRFSPIFFTRASRVVGFNPNNSAAPLAPLIFQSVF